MSAAIVYKNKSKTVVLDSLSLVCVCVNQSVRQWIYPLGVSQALSVVSLNMYLASYLVRYILTQT